MGRLLGVLLAGAVGLAGLGLAADAEARGGGGHRGGHSSSRSSGHSAGRHIGHGIARGLAAAGKRNQQRLSPVGRSGSGRTGQPGVGRQATGASPAVAPECRVGADGVQRRDAAGNCI